MTVVCFSRGERFDRCDVGACIKDAWIAGLGRVSCDVSSVNPSQAGGVKGDLLFYFVFFAYILECGEGVCLSLFCCSQSVPYTLSWFRVYGHAEFCCSFHRLYIDTSAYIHTYMFFSAR